MANRHGRRMFRTWDGEELRVMLGPAPDLIPIEDYFDWCDQHLGELADDADSLRHPEIGLAKYDDLWVPGSIFLVTLEVHPQWRRRGIATWMVAGIRALHPGLDLIADAERANSSDGNAFVRGFNRRHGGRAIRRLRAGEPRVSGYRPGADDIWTPLPASQTPL